jgi:omega-6 fatty acid desaturase (delta-12 desaturase)
MTETNYSSVKNERSWEKMVLKYAHSDIKSSIWQICNSFIPYILMWFVLYESLRLPYWTTVLLSLIAGGFLIRLFIIFHDCGHGSFFKSSRLNNTVGTIIGMLVFTPYSHWHHNHKIHHATSGDLDKRGIGDVWTLTVEEYLKLSKWDKFLYRIYRNPLIMFTFGSFYLVLIKNRLTTKQMSSKGKWNVYITNAGALLIAISISMLISFKSYLLIQLPIIILSHSIGLWLFYVQHQFGEVFWERGAKWDYKTAALEGSSFLKFTPVLQWFTGNIGFHHVHHLSSRIPNYKLAKCHYENELFKDVKPITLLKSIPALHMRLWDESNRELISFKKLRLNYTIKESRVLTFQAD